jgi:hypothetical protein
VEEIPRKIGAGGERARRSSLARRQREQGVPAAHCLDLGHHGGRRKVEDDGCEWEVKKSKVSPGTLFKAIFALRSVRLI